MSTDDQPIEGLLATSGIVALVLGLALQSTLADLFSGIALNIEDPFGAGDRITVDGGNEGQAIEINWRATRIRNRSGDTTVIPNSQIAKSTPSCSAPVRHHRRTGNAADGVDARHIGLVELIDVMLGRRDHAIGDAVPVGDPSLSEQFIQGIGPQKHKGSLTSRASALFRKLVLADRRGAAPLRLRSGRRYRGSRVLRIAFASLEVSTVDEC